MKCHELARRLEAIQPEAAPQDIARACLLVANSSTQLDDLADPRQLLKAWREVGLKVNASTDQHAAMTEELDALASGDPQQFSADQIWVLIRAIKVQSQILEMYVGHPVLDV